MRASRPTPPHLTSVQAEQILAQACENESQNAKRMRLGLEPISQPLTQPTSSPQVRSPGQQVRTAWQRSDSFGGARTTAPLPLFFRSVLFSRTDHSACKIRRVFFCDIECVVFLLALNASVLIDSI